MSSRLGSLTASLALAALTFGLATPAFADIAPEPGNKPEPETKAEQDNDKADKPADAKAEKVAEKTSGKCSITDAPERDLAGFALAVLLISGVALGRRRRDA